MSRNERTAEEQEMLNRLGDHLRKLRKARDISQEDFAVQAGLGRSYYTEIENGRRNVSIINLFRIAQTLGVTLQEVVGYEMKE